MALREKCPNTGFFLVRIFLYLDWILEKTDQKKLCIWTLFTQCDCWWKKKQFEKKLLNLDSRIFYYRRKFLRTETSTVSRFLTYSTKVQTIKTFQNWSSTKIYVRYIFQTLSLVKFSNDFKFSNFSSYVKIT